MQDAPTPHELIEVVTRFLRETAAKRLDGPVAYEARIAASLLATVQRQLARPAGRDADELGGLRALLQGVDGDLAELNRVLCSRIQSRQIAWDDPALLQHLWRVTIDKLEVDQPTYSTYRRVARTADTQK